MKRSQRAPVVMPSELVSIDHPFYNSPTVHKEMLSDKVRTVAFDKALKKVVRKGDNVFDLGTGTSIMSLLAARSGAAKVYASDSADGMYYAAKRIIKDNKLDNKIKVVAYQGKKLHFPVKMDLIVSECLGHFGFDEGMIQAVADSKYLLKPDGKFMPSRVRLFVAATSNPLIYKENIDSWKKPYYGFDMGSMRKRSLEQIYIQTFSESDLVSDPLMIIDYEVGKPASSLIGKGTIKIRKSATVYGLVGWFEADLAPGVTLSTSPFSPKTHWEQSFLAIPRPIVAKAGQELKVELGVISHKDFVNRTHTIVEFSWSVGSGPKKLASKAFI